MWGIAYPESTLGFSRQGRCSLYLNLGGSVFDLEREIYMGYSLVDRTCRDDINICVLINNFSLNAMDFDSPLLTYSRTFCSVKPPLHSSKISFLPFQRSLILFAAARRPGLSKLSSMTMSAPASIASSASASD